METTTLILILAVIVLLYLFITLKRDESALKRELEQYKAETHRKAQEQFQQWRDKECEAIRLQQLDIARREAKTLLEEWKCDEEFTIRADAINRSQSVIVGKVTEHLIPYLPDFNYNPKDVRFFGNPVDLIVFDGLSDGYVKKIVFIEVKTGKASRLTRRQQNIREVIERGPVRWETMRVNHISNSVNSPISVEDIAERNYERKRDTVMLLKKRRAKP